MADDSSEEKTLPASKKKLDDARKKGQVAQSKDMVSAVTMIGALGVLVTNAGSVAMSGQRLIAMAGEMAGKDLWMGLAGMGGAVRDAVVRAAAPSLLLAVGGAVLGNMIVLRGFLFATEPVTPQFSNINPVEGFKRLFKTKALIELAKSFVKILLLGAVLAVVLMSGLRALVLAPTCGLSCVAGTFRALITPMLGAAALMFLGAGLADVGLQRWLFLRDQRMSHSERKRETKEQDGDPKLRQWRRRMSREAAEMPGRLGVGQAVLLVHDGGARVLGLRFKRGETPVPVVVSRGLGERAALLLREGRRLGIAEHEDAALTAALVRGAPPGSFIPESTYSLAAAALARYGLV